MNPGADGRGGMTRRKYSIPADGEVLNTAQLRAHTAFTIAEALRSLRGRWGFFSPSDLDPEEKANRFSADGDCLLIQNLALILPDGFTCRERELRKQIPPGGGSIHVTWTLPENDAANDGAVRVGLEIMDKDGKGETENAAADPEQDRCCATGTIGDVDEANRVVLSAPALSLDAAACLHDAWNELVGILIERIAGPIEQSPRGEPFERRLVFRALHRLRRVPPDTEPGRAIRELEAVLESLVDFAKAHAGTEVAGETESLLLDTGSMSNSGTATLVDFLQKLVRVVNDELESTISWLHGGNLLVLKPEARETDDSRKVLEYSVPETGARSVLITFFGNEAINAWIDFSDVWEPVHGQAAEGGVLKVRRKLPPGTRGFKLQCAGDVDVTVAVE